MKWAPRVCGCRHRRSDQGFERINLHHTSDLIPTFPGGERSDAPTPRLGPQRASGVLYPTVVTAGDAYLVGREIIAELPVDAGGVDQLYASIRADGSRLEGVKFAHCTFANVSFKDCVLDEATFTDCAFIDCYFRNTKIEKSKFSGCKFVNSDLSKVDIRSCDFRYYNSFANCLIKFGQLRESLPGEGNLRAHLCANLAQEARKAGLTYDEGLYRQAGAEAFERHMFDAIRGTTPYFKEHYRGSGRVSAAYRWAASRLRGLAWGYRRSWLVVLRNWSILSLGVFPLLFLALGAGLERDGKRASASDAWLASLGNILPGSGLSDVHFVSGWTLALAFIEVLLGLLFAALITALLFRSVFEREK
ncbi:pentapeptide repeat-containing protein [Mycolicibacterium xanthum]|uniref:pentapeptide repeat-containing protein n=1 Tax=Mycolicibacterium xanthum TaxID=2796469 RepID=UPI003556AA55